ncbi:GNAT family N-acetyltransferase [Actinomadura rupiterrae]|uniref:GNAT family N-acetyltransferase n=1 Tax=Actinomadura rupiterrae TaxID=559627 RepID=UPI0020A2DEBC|nr:GNAT family N-acetyltransferase [Actinomadura rupiterrae]MCP2337323.1 GNAT superfamily N-acetyltransferase [Actinomadura rupiterrae]
MIVTFRHFGSKDASELRDVVADIHQDAYGQKIAEGDRFAAEQAFMRRFDAYTQRDGFDLVIAYNDGWPIGQAWGWPLPADTAWWDGLQTPVHPGYTDEDGTRTFALSELMVRQESAGQGIGHRLHDELLGSRPEQRATLLVRPTNHAYEAYRRWGWKTIGQLRPDIPDAPTFDVLMLELPLQR